MFRCQSVTIDFSLSPRTSTSTKPTCSILLPLLRISRYVLPFWLLKRFIPSLTKDKKKKKKGIKKPKKKKPKEHSRYYFSSLCVWSGLFFLSLSISLTLIYSSFFFPYSIQYNSGSPSRLSHSKAEQVGAKTSVASSS